LSPRWNFTAYFTDAATALLGIPAAEIADIRAAPAIMHFVGGYKPWLDEYARLSRFHAEFNALRAELERDLDPAGFVWPGRFGGPTRSGAATTVSSSPTIGPARQRTPTSSRRAPPPAPSWAS